MDMVKGRIALISGATSEIGEAIAMRLAANGATVVVSDCDSNRVDALVSRMQGGTGKVMGITADPTNALDVKKTVGAALDRHGRVDILVNNVDHCLAGGICEISEDDWHLSIKENLSSVFFFCREVMPRMREKQYGRVIIVGDLDYLGWPGRASYSAAKSAIFGFTRSLALEMAKDNVTVNCVAKGDIRSSELSEEEIERIKGVVSVPRIGTPEDVANAVGFFSSETSRYLTGQTLFVCGGKSIHSSMSV